MTAGAGMREGEDDGSEDGARASTFEGSGGVGLRVERRGTGAESPYDAEPRTSDGAANRTA